MADKLLIVESPAKARTLGKYLGREFAVKASVGHIRDLPKSSLGVDEASGFEPEYEISADKVKVVDELRRAARAATEVWLATDPDREGEAISWHIAELLRDLGRPLHRVEFHEITKKAVQEAISHPRDLDMDRVDAQQARRVIDRLIGYRLSPLLWDKVKRGLSAGRVQSVAFKMVCDREAEIDAFDPEEYWLVDALVAAPEPPEFRLRLTRRDGRKKRPGTADEAAAARGTIEAGPLRVDKVARKSSTQSPKPPFITSQLQQEAATPATASGAADDAARPAALRGRRPRRTWDHRPHHLHADRLRPGLGGVDRRRQGADRRALGRAGSAAHAEPLSQPLHGAGRARGDPADRRHPDPGGGGAVPRPGRPSRLPAHLAAFRGLADAPATSSTSPRSRSPSAATA